MLVTSVRRYSASKGAQPSDQDEPRPQSGRHGGDGIIIAYLDQGPSRCVAIKVEASQGRNLEALDIEGKEVNLGDARLIQNLG